MGKCIVTFVTLLAMMLVSCRGGENGNESLGAEYERLKLESRLNKEYMNDITTTINAIQDSLHSIAEREAVVRLGQNAIESRSQSDLTQRRQVEADIQFLDHVIAKSKEEISRLRKRISLNQFQLDGLEKIVQRLNQTLGERDQELARLRKDLRRITSIVSEKDSMLQSSHEQISEMALTIKSERDEHKATISDITTGYVAVGTDDELSANGVVIIRGGNFLGGGAMVPNGEMDLSRLPTIVTTENGLIPFNREFSAVRLITPHAPNSYHLIKNKGIEITNAKQFWHLSRILIAVLEDE
jgi:hypothetical protein